MIRRPRRGATGGVAVALVVTMVAVPVAAVLWRTVRPEGTWDLEAFGRILGSARTWRLVGVTTAQAAVSSLVTVAIGVPVAWVLARRAFPGRALVRAATTVPFVLPSVVIGAAFASLLGPRGLVDLRGTWWPILAAHLCFNLAVVVRTVGAAFGGLSPDLEPAARLLGARPGAAFVRLVVPAVAPTIASAALIVFLFCLTSFGVVVILGGGPVSTIEVEIWTRATRQFDLPGAGVLAIVQVLAVIATLGLHARVARRATAHLRAGGRRRLEPPRTPGERLGVVAAVVAVAVVAVVPLLALAERSVRVADGYGLEHWRRLGTATAGTALSVAPTRAVATSLSAAVVATTLALALALPASGRVARRVGGIADRVLLLPLGVSATTIGLGLLLAVGRPPVDLRGSWWIVPLAQALIAIPLIVRAVAPAIRALPGSMLDAAATLGSGPRERWWRVELPAVRRAVVAGAGLGLVACLGEFGATVFVARSDRPTVPVVVARLMSRPGGDGFGQAMALSCVLVVLCGVLLWIVDRVAGGDTGADGDGPTF